MKYFFRKLVDYYSSGDRFVITISLFIIILFGIASSLEGSSFKIDFGNILNFRNTGQTLTTNSFETTSINQQNTSEILHPTRVVPTLTPRLYLEDTSYTVDVTGEILPIAELGILQNEFELNKDPESKRVFYFSAGTVQGGPYSSYERIVMVYSGPGAIYSFIFLTNDRQKYILYGDSNVSESEYPLSEIDRTKITKVEQFNFGFPEKIKLSPDKPEVITRKQLFTTFSKVRERSQADLSIDAELKKLDLRGKLTVSQVQYKPLDLTGSLSDDKYSIAKNTYVESEGQLIVSDHLGLSYYYDYNISDNFPITEFPSEKISFENTDQWYSHYGGLETGGCDKGDSPTIAKNIFRDQLSYAGDVDGVSLYKLTDINSPVYPLIRDQKFYSDSEHAFTIFSEQLPIPTTESYLSKVPLLFFYDHWKRLNILGEEYYSYPGGCGKPVIYLYPTKPTEVSLQFIAPIRFSSTIPEFKNGWKVFANPNGELKDLNKFKECNDYEVNVFGHEYAKGACEKNAYPYLYWSGDRMGYSYETPNEGWYVAKRDLGSFMKHKLGELGLSHGESYDMREYWIPYLTKKNAPFYRISFLQTEEVNSLFPISVSPRPDTSIRIFIHWEALSGKPESEIPPQTLYKTDRKGFTLVEWGGLKK